MCVNRASVAVSYSQHFLSSHKVIDCDCFEQDP